MRRKSPVAPNSQEISIIKHPQGTDNVTVPSDATVLRSLSLFNRQQQHPSSPHCLFAPLLLFLLPAGEGQDKVTGAAAAVSGEPHGDEYINRYAAGLLGI